MTTIDILKKTRAARGGLAVLDEAGKNALLLSMADSLLSHEGAILAENEADMSDARGHISDVMLDRLYLDEKRLAAMVEGVRAIAALSDHTGRILSEVHRPNGMTIYKKQVPLGLVAIIYESRPNVTSDAAVLAMKSGNVSKKNTAMGWALYNNAANSGDTETALDVLSDMVQHQRSAAQALQATRILKQLSPETQLYQAQRSIAILQTQLNEEYGDDKAPKLKIDQTLAEQFMKAADQAERDAVLANIGRKHSAQDILDCYAEARAAGHDDINMDLIAGLPEDTPDGFARSLDEVISMGADNITVHTLSLKKGSRIMLEGSRIPGADEVAQMLDYADPTLRKHGFAPYYLYRQKYMSGSFENVGWTKPGGTGLYNIYIMEELHSILSLGAGGSTKMVGGGQIRRAFNAKYPREYIDRPEKRRANLMDFARFYAEQGE